MRRHKMADQNNQQNNPYNNPYDFDWFGYDNSEQGTAVADGPIQSGMLVRDIILAHPDAAEILMQIGMGCISCPASLMESLSDACAVHGLDADEVAKYLNQELHLTDEDKKQEKLSESQDTKDTTTQSDETQEQEDE